MKPVLLGLGLIYLALLVAMMIFGGRAAHSQLLTGVSWSASGGGSPVGPPAGTVFDSPDGILAMSPGGLQ